MGSDWVEPPGSVQDAEADDVRAEALVRLLARLRYARFAEPIADLLQPGDAPGELGRAQGPPCLGGT